MRGVEDEARQRGYSVIFCDANEDPELEQQHLITLFSRRVDGVLLARQIPTLPRTALHGAVFPWFSLTESRRDIRVRRRHDNLGAAREAGRHLIGLGHRRIAIIAGRLDLSNGLARLEGFRQSLQEANLPLHDEYSRCGDFTLESGYRLRRSSCNSPPAYGNLQLQQQNDAGLMRVLLNFESLAGAGERSRIRRF